jgi:hypothetical protein
MNPFEGLTREVKSIELGGQLFYFKPVSMGVIREIQSIKDSNELAAQMVVKSICDKNGKPLEGFKAEYLSVLSPSELMEIVTFAQSVSMPSAEKKS